jgi:hypothetical protein
VGQSPKTIGNEFTVQGFKIDNSANMALLEYSVEEWISEQMVGITPFFKYVELTQGVGNTMKVKYTITVAASAEATAIARVLSGLTTEAKKSTLYYGLRVVQQERKEDYSITLPMTLANTNAPTTAAPSVLTTASTSWAGASPAPTTTTLMPGVPTSALEFHTRLGAIMHGRPWTQKCPIYNTVLTTDAPANTVPSELKQLQMYFATASADARASIIQTTLTLKRQAGVNCGTVGLTNLVS